MIFSLRNSRGDEMPLFDNPYFVVTDVDGMTQADVAISSSVMSDFDGDIINSKTVNPRTITITLRVKQHLNPEIVKRYVMSFVKPKKECTLYLDYKERQSTITGVVQSLDMPRFTNAVAMQFSIYCSNPLWEDLNAFATMITNVTSLHYWPIIPKETPDIVMGEMMDAYKQEIINNGDVSIGMDIIIVANGDVKNPMIYREESSEFFGINVTMKKLDELLICTIKGEKTIILRTWEKDPETEETINIDTLIFDKIMEGSTWIQLDVGKNNIVINDDYGAKNMQCSITCNERYV